MLSHPKGLEPERDRETILFLLFKAKIKNMPYLSVSDQYFQINVLLWSLENNKTERVFCNISYKNFIQLFIVLTNYLLNLRRSTFLIFALIEKKQKNGFSVEVPTPLKKNKELLDHEKLMESYFSQSHPRFSDNTDNIFYSYLPVAKVEQEGNQYIFLKVPLLMK